MEISVIIPLHEWNDKVKELYEKAIETVSEQDGVEDRPDVLVVYAAALESNEDFSKNLSQEYDKLKVSFIKNEGKTDFQSQINLAANEVKTRFFSILEFDDEYSTTYFKLMNSYINSPEFKDVELFLPIIVETNDKDQALKLTNETVWSKQFVGENGTMGYLNKDSLNNYTDFKICGGLFKTDEFNTAGGLKSNIKLTFQYEFLLRYLNNASKIYTVPKIGYKHLVMREGSLFDTLSKTMMMDERKFWFDTAKKEANFFNDRPIDFLAFEKTRKEGSQQPNVQPQQ
jgi:hypothetical protein